MSTHKQIDRICCGVLVFVLLLTILFMNAGKLGVEAVAHVMGYESGLFDTSVVHTIDIEMEDWDSFLESCTNEEYAACSLVIDQDVCKNVAIRAKGNTSLTSVASYGNDRYSFKVEFDHYDQANTYYGLDKLCLNNIIQDNTYMKDYVTYQMMAGFGADAPLCSFAYITVNGEDFGLYLAVEGVEESFLERNYGNDYGELYKPDSMSMGGGRGNGAGFAPEDMDEFREKMENEAAGGNVSDKNTEESASESQQRNGNEPEDMVNPAEDTANPAEGTTAGDEENPKNEMPPEGAVSGTEGMPSEGAENSENAMPPEGAVPGTEGMPLEGAENPGNGMLPGDMVPQQEGMPPEGAAPQQDGIPQESMGNPQNGVLPGDAAFQQNAMLPEGMANSGNGIPQGDTGEAENGMTSGEDAEAEAVMPSESTVGSQNEAAQNEAAQNEETENEATENGATENGAVQENTGNQTQGKPAGMRDERMQSSPGGMSMGSDDVSLIYTDDEYDSYSNIFDSAKTEITDADKDRLIASLKALNEGNDIENVVNVEEVIRYFVVHNFVCNFDSYTGSMIHNYYLYEKDGQFSMIPWDYNLAFGGFESGTDAQSLVNYPIDSPVSGGTIESRPMLAWIFASEEYTELYHQYFAEFVEQYFTNGEFERMIDTVSEMIAPYVEKDPTKFCSYEEFQEGVSTLKLFCTLRAESIRRQLDGTISSTEISKHVGTEEQEAGDSEVIEAANLSIAAMGTMGNGSGRRGGPGEAKPGTEGFPGGNEPASEDIGEENMTVPEEVLEKNASEGSATPPEEFSEKIVSEGSATLPEDFQGQNMTLPQDFPGGAMPADRDSRDMRAMAQPNMQRNDMRNIWIITGGSILLLFAGVLYVRRYQRYV